jgi:hypothetical protein
MQRNLRGELSCGQDGSTKTSRMLTHCGFITKEDQAELESVMLPAFTVRNVIEGNISELKELKNYVSSLCFKLRCNFVNRILVSAISSAMSLCS